VGFSVFTSRLLATDLNTKTNTSNHYEVFFPFLVQSPWNLGTQLKLSWTDPLTPFHDGFVSFTHGFSATADSSVMLEPFIVLRHEPHRKHTPLLSELLCNPASSCSISHRVRSSHCWLFAGKGLPNCCLETGCITPSFYCYMRVLLSNSCLCGSTVIAWSKYATVYVYI
jgi:hypothetical protein